MNSCSLTANDQGTGKPVFVSLNRSFSRSQTILEKPECALLRYLFENPVLPAEFSGYNKPESFRLLEFWGLVFRGPDPGNGLFRLVDLPDHWQKKVVNEIELVVLDATNQPRLCASCRTQGNEKRASFSIRNRYIPKIHRVEIGRKAQVIEYRIYDGEEMIKSLPPVLLPELGDERSRMVGQALHDAWNWLDRNFPHWRDPGAYRD